MFGKTFSTSSFVYRLLAWPNEYVPRYKMPDTICELRGAIIGKLLFFLAISFFTVIVFGSISSFILYQVTCALPHSSGCTYGLNMFTRLGGVTSVIALGLIGFSTVMFVGLKTVDFVENVWNKRQLEGKVFIKDDNPVVEVLRAWKDKICYKVEFK